MHRYSQISQAVTYGLGSFSGEAGKLSCQMFGNIINAFLYVVSFIKFLVIDQVALSDDLIIYKQTIGAATEVMDPQFDGILGIGPVDLTAYTMPQVPLIPTVTDNLVRQGTIKDEVIGISFEPSATADVVNGFMTFGGTDSSKYTGQITYTPITSTPPSSAYWGIDMSVKYGDLLLFENTSGIVDTGTTQLLFATDKYQAYQQATGATVDSYVIRILSIQQVF